MNDAWSVAGGWLSVYGGHYRVEAIGALVPGNGLLEVRSHGRVLMTTVPCEAGAEAAEAARLLDAIVEGAQPDGRGLPPGRPGRPR